MDIFMLLFLSVISILIGIIITLVVQYYVLLKYFDRNPQASPPKKPHSEICSLPETLRQKLEVDGQESTDSSMAISLMLQFLFHELRYSETIKHWLYKKLSLEFEELITKTTTGKFFDAVTIRDMNLGSQFPNVKNLGVENVTLDKNEGHIDTLSLCMKVDYSGNFLISVDAKMKFGKTAYLSIKVKQVTGLARLQFTRFPYTHWSFSFYEEPQLELAVESHFQGRQLQSNITNLIVNQIKKAIKRKHTLPNYKIRYKPFFIKSDPGQLDTLDDGEIIPQGKLEVTCIEISRLASITDITQVYCTFAVDFTAWISVHKKELEVVMILELRVNKTNQQQLGVSFKFDQTCVTVDSVTPQLAADKASLKVGDILLAVEGKPITNIVQLNKILKLLPCGNFSVRIERLCNNYVWKSKTDLKTPTVSKSINESLLISENTDLKTIDMPDVTAKSKSGSLEKTRNEKMPLPKIISTSNENVSKFAQTIGNFSLRKRKPSIERPSTDSSSKSTPNVSLPSTPQHTSYKHSVIIPSVSILSAKKQCIQEYSETSKEPEAEVVVYSKIHKGQINEFMPVINCKEEYLFHLKDTDKYLNVNVWGVTTSGKEVLLGYSNVPLAEILNKCSNSLLGHYIRSFSFLPPTSRPPTIQTHPLMVHSGFEHVFCYGDALLSFVWTCEEGSEIKRKAETMHSSSYNDFVMVTKHDFVRTQFHRTTHCDFCSKKIWLKDAVQCNKCNVCCHKKCLLKCQLNMPCILQEKFEQKMDGSDILNPDIIMTEVTDDDLECDISSFQGTEVKHYSSLKRVNSANNLAIPGSHFTQNLTRSLPPSPQHTPRKLSLVVSNPFSACPIMLDEIQLQPNTASEHILNAVDQILQYPSDESLMDVAKQTGAQLYANMRHEIKVEKINLMVTELKKTLDDVTMEHMTLTKQLSVTEGEVEKAKLAFLIGQADAKIQALSVLMLHFCSGLQHTQEKIV
ncbi:hypothetical protein FQA39_LY17795 [Lamprigera yunnana]|nr:hypothetical protein FQA39_LY17795 [Lamprigera yunnana]